MFSQIRKTRVSVLSLLPIHRIWCAVCNYPLVLLNWSERLRRYSADSLFSYEMFLMNLSYCLLV